MSVSIIISSRNEERTIPFTITNLMIDMDQAGIKDYEFIIADNGSEDGTSRFFTHGFNNPACKTSDTQVISHLKKNQRGMVTDGILRFCHDPVFSNVGARHNAVKYARYENIIFCDAHIALKTNTIKYALETLNKFGGIVHMPVAWMGAHSSRPRAGMQYSYKIGEKIWGAWNFAQASSDKPFFIPVSGHCFLAVKKKQYMEMGGYDTNQQIYGGGENYLDTLYWMLGSCVMTDPRGLVYHLSASRGYSYNMNSLIHNMMLTAYALGGHKWSERILVTYMNKPGTNKEFIKQMYDKAILRAQPKRDFIDKNKKMSLEEVLGLTTEPDCDGECRGAKYKGRSHHVRRVWDKMNDDLHGRHLSFVQVFEDWLDRLVDPDAIEFFKNSPHQ